MVARLTLVVTRRIVGNGLIRAPAPLLLCRRGWPGGLNTGAPLKVDRATACSRDCRGFRRRRHAPPSRASFRQGPVRQARSAATRLADLGYDVDTVLTGAWVGAIKTLARRKPTAVRLSLTTCISDTRNFEPRKHAGVPIVRPPDLEQ